LVACLTIVGCAPIEEHAWREEVELSDGRIITVERSGVWEEVQGFGQPTRYSENATTLTLPEEPGRTAAPTWYGKAEHAVLLDFDAARKEFVLVTLPASCNRYKEEGKPRPPYIEYRLRGGQWTRVTLDQKLIGRQANLLVYPRALQQSQVVSAQDKADRQASMPGLGARLVAGGGLPGC
jgi:hypothetical protein